jgi:putative tryptophan/tyrosine transport system substrate-binding protein
MRRREFITLLGGAAAAWPPTARAQRPQRMRRIGVLMGYVEGDADAQSNVAAFREEFQKLGWRQDQNVRFEYRWATSNVELMQRYAKELVALAPDLILSSGTPTTAALVQQTSTIPIVFTVVVDPVGSGFVASLARPGRNVTGFMNLDPSMAGKWVELLKEISPRTVRVAIPIEPATASYWEIYMPHFKVAAAAFGMEAIPAMIHDMAEFEAFVAAQAREPNGGLIPMPGGFPLENRAEITALAARHRLPAVYWTRAFTQVGGLLSYGNDNADNWRRTASYVDRILKGENPSELPVQFPVKFELLVNLKTARALGLDVTLQLQQRADEVIE